MVNIIFSIYFKSNHLDAIILISYEYLEKEKRIKLEEIKFFENAADAVTYIKTEDFALIEEDAMIHDRIQDLRNLLTSYLSGKNVDLYNMIQGLNIKLSLKEKFPTKFSQEVIKTVINLNQGELTTYFEIGDKIKSRAYRAIGNVLKHNPLPLVIPCHRVLRKNGEIGGYMGKIDKTWETNLKKQLLKLEGHPI
ncbi:MAG: methylated-DNA--[protein]-cysteine S-methyltransferase [Candidatus Hodarchaeota archaeon]